MPRWNRTAAAVALLLSIGACTSGGGGTPGQAPEPAAQAGGDDVDSVTVTPEAKLEGSCEPLAQEDDDGRYLAADLVVRNTGNIGIVVAVAATWRQPGRQYVTTSQRVRLDLDQSVPVKLRLDIGKREARRIKRMVDRERPCYVRVRVAGAFGEPRQ